MGRRVEERHFSEHASRLEDPEFLFFAGLRFLDHLAATLHDDADVLKGFPFRENHRSGRVELSVEQVLQFLALGGVHAAEEGTFGEGVIGKRCRHQIPPRTVARPTRPMPMMYAAVRSDTCFSWAMFHTRSKLSTMTRSSSLRTRARSQLKCWRFWTHSK